MQDLEMEHFVEDLNDIQSFEDFSKYLCYLPNSNRKDVASERTADRPRRACKHFNPLRDLSEDQFRLKYRFSSETMRKIIEMIRDDLEVERNFNLSNQVPVDLQIMAAIRIWGMTEDINYTANVHGVTCRTLTKICKRVAGALAAKSSYYIRMPITLAEKESVTNEFENLAGMSRVIGVVAQHVVYLKLIGKDLKPRKDSVHIQLVSDASYKIRDLDCKIKYSDIGAEEIFSQSRIKERMEQNEFRGRVLLGDERFSFTTYINPPIHCPTSIEDEAFNRSHSITYAPVVKCMSMWKHRFGILCNNTSWCISHNQAKQTIIALALLHNLAIEWKDPICGAELTLISYINK